MSSCLLTQNDSTAINVSNAINAFVAIPPTCPSSTFTRTSPLPAATDAPTDGFSDLAHLTATAPTATAPPPSATAATAIPSDALTVEALGSWSREYLQDCELRLQSPHTMETRRVFIGNLLWFLQAKSYQVCDARALRQFLYYLAHGHEEAGGRFGNRHLKRPVRPVTIKDYDRCLRSLFAWLVAQNVLGETPFARIARPLVRDEIKAPLSLDQIEALLQAATRSLEPARNRALLLFLLDTGCRAGELVSIKLRDLDMANGRCRVLGKGGKYRTLYFGEHASQALFDYLSRCLNGHRNNLSSGVPGCRTELSAGGTSACGNPTCGNPDWPLFYSGRLPASPDKSDEGKALAAPQPFTRSGLLHLIKRLGAAAGIRDACCVHALRRTFAVQMLRNGANVFSVQALLGHSDLQQTRQYCAIALTDAEAQHHAFSPADRLSQSPGT